MSYEIERKFLLKTDGWRQGATAHEIQQAYLSREPHRTVRVRWFDDQAWMTVKGPTTGITRQEVEFPLDPTVAAELFDMCLEGRVRKTRHEIVFGGTLWEVDEFHDENEGLIVAEVELPAETSTFERPPWLGAEVTADSRFSNSALARRPWSAWTQDERAGMISLGSQD